MEVQRTTVQKKGNVLQQEYGKTAETIAGWRRLCRLLSRKMGEHLSPACLDELIKARALKFSRLHRLDQLIQSRAQKMNGARVNESCCPSAGASPSLKILVKLLS